MKIRFYGIILLLVTALLTFIVFNVTELHNEANENQYNRLTNDLSQVTTRFASWVNTKTGMLETSKDIVDNFSCEEVVAYHTENPFLNINNEDPDVSQVYIGLANGGFVTGGQWIPPEDYDPRTRTWYKEALAAEDTIISKIYIDRETGNQLVTISSPLYLENEFAGVIAADVFLTDIHNFLRDILEGDKVYSYLIDSDGAIVAHTLDESFIGQYINLEDNDLSRSFKQAKGTDELIRIQYEFNNQNVQGIIQKIIDVQWFLVVAVKDENPISNFSVIDNGALGFNLVLLVVIMSLLLIIVRMKRTLDTNNEKLRMDNEKDFLTGIYNRRYFNLSYEKMWRASLIDDSISLLIMDIDFFKNYNDTYGHLKGDDVLKDIVDIIHSQIRKEDILARYGGEEFILLLNQVPLDKAVIIGDKIRQAVFDANMEHIDAPLGRMTISVGVATGNREKYLESDALINEADSYLYKAKEAGRNRVESELNQG